MIIMMVVVVDDMDEIMTVEVVVEAVIKAVLIVTGVMRKTLK